MRCIGYWVGVPPHKDSQRVPPHPPQTDPVNKTPAESNFMKAYVYGANGAEITDVAKPSPKGTQVLVHIRANGLNRADLGMTKGHAHGAAGGVGTVLGMEWSGEVAELGPDAKGVKVGDKIMGSGGAAFAEYTLADHGRLFRSPSNMNFEEAATLPVPLATMP